MRYGLRYVMNGEEVRLWQIGGGGRVLLCLGSHKWWSKPQRGVQWTIYETEDGQTFPDKEAAELAAKNLAE